MTADQIIAAMLAENIGHDADRIRKEWTLNQSQATDKYLALTAEEKKTVCDAAIAHVRCEFCGAPAGRACGIVPPFTKALDHYAHCGRWMDFIINEELYLLLGYQKPNTFSSPAVADKILLDAGHFDAKPGPAAALIDNTDISDLF